MSILTQIVLGSALLILCSLIHVAMLVWSIALLTKIGDRFEGLATKRYWSLMIGSAFSVIVVSHTIQVWIWALSFVAIGAITDFGEAIYFALVTYTTLGYGDVTLGAGSRIFGAMASVTGLLTFGLSTAFLAGLLARLLARKTD